MSEHFLLTRAAKTLSLAQVFRMTDGEAETTFKALRWADTNGAPVCPFCGTLDAYEARRPNGALRFRCKGCKKDFSITSGTLFASQKLPLKAYLAAIAIFCNEVKGKSALALSRDLGLSYKTAFVLLHKCREAMAEEMRGRVVGGEGKEAEIDGGYFGGYIRPANHKEDRKDRRLAPIKTASARLWLSSVNVAAHRSRQCLHRKAQPVHSSALASPRERPFTLTKAAHGTSCMIASK
jgi:transposase-like protein